MTLDIPRRIHITGGAGSGKTTLASRLGKLLDVPVLGLDGQALDLLHGTGLPIDFDALASMRREDAQRFVVQNDAWVSEGACILPYRLLYERADIVVWLDGPGGSRPTAF